MPDGLGNTPHAQRVKRGLRRLQFQSIQLAPGEVALFSVHVGTIVARLDDGYPHRDGGYGGWEDVERPGRIPAARWAGSPTLTMSLPIILGEWRQGWRGSIEDEIRMLERLARQPAGAGRGEHPPLLRLRGPVPHGGAIWAINGLEWRDATVVDGQRVRARLTLMLRRHVAVDLVEVRPRRRAPATRRYKVKQGEAGRNGLTRIVVRELGARGSRAVNAAKRRVLRLNRLRDGRQIRAGMRLRLPR